MLSIFELRTFHRNLLLATFLASAPISHAADPFQDQQPGTPTSFTIGMSCSSSLSSELTNLSIDGVLWNLKQKGISIRFWGEILQKDYTRFHAHLHPVSSVDPANMDRSELISALVSLVREGIIDLLQKPFAREVSESLHGREIVDLASGDPQTSATIPLLAHIFGAARYIGVDLELRSPGDTMESAFKDFLTPNLQIIEQTPTRYIQSDVIDYLKSKIQPPEFTPTTFVMMGMELMPWKSFNDYIKRKENRTTDPEEKARLKAIKSLFRKNNHELTYVFERERRRHGKTLEQLISRQNNFVTELMSALESASKIGDRVIDFENEKDAFPFKDYGFQLISTGTLPSSAKIWEYRGRAQ